MIEWHKAESAPKDGTPFLASGYVKDLRKYTTKEVWWDDDHNAFVSGYETIWVGCEYKEIGIDKEFDLWTQTPEPNRANKPPKQDSDNG